MLHAGTLARRNESPLPSEVNVKPGSERLQVELEAPKRTGHSFNPYDITAGCDKGELCYDFSQVGKFLQRRDVKRKLGVPESMEWQECDANVHTALTGDWLQNLEVHIPDLLANGVRVLVYVGDRDFICNYVGNEAWLNSMEWHGKKSFANKAFSKWHLEDGTEAGEVKSEDGLLFLKVYEAGHMVPMDQPHSALKLLEEFTANEPFRA